MIKTRTKNALRAGKKDKQIENQIKNEVVRKNRSNIGVHAQS